MAHIIDIGAKLDNAKPVLQLDENEVYEIDDRKDNVLKIQQFMEKAETKENVIDAMAKAVEMMIGKAAMKKIEETHPGLTQRVSTIQVLYIAGMAALGGESYEAVEERFRTAGKNA